MIAFCLLVWIVMGILGMTREWSHDANAIITVILIVGAYLEK